MTTQWCLHCPTPVAAIGEVDGDPVCIAHADDSLVRYREIPRPVAVAPVVRPQRKRPIPGATRFRFDAAISRVAGKMTDREAARQVGCRRETVRKYRYRFGIAAFVDHECMSQGAAQGNRLRGLDNWLKVAPHIGRMFDAEVERLTGVATKTVAAIRQRRGIPAFRKQDAIPGAVITASSVGVRETVA